MRTTHARAIRHWVFDVITVGVSDTRELDDGPSIIVVRVGGVRPKPKAYSFGTSGARATRIVGLAGINVSVTLNPGWGGIT